MKQTLTLKNVNERIDKLEKKLDLMLKKLEKCEPKYPILSSITEVGTIVDLGAFKVRLLDTNYNGTGKKCWQPIDVLFPGEAGLGLPNDKNDGGYQRAIGLFKQFKVIDNMLDTRIKDQIVNVEIPCYIPERKEIINLESRFFLLSATEMCQNRPYLAKEGRPLEFYIKNTPEFNDWQWIRTPYLDYSNNWGFVYSDGHVSNGSTDYSSGVAPAFCTD